MDLIEIIFERAGALNNYWNLYIAVTFGVLGLMASGKQFTKHWSVKFLLSAAFLAFAFANLEAIYSINQQRLELIKLVDDKFVFAVNHARPASDVLLFLFHLGLDALVVLCIWFVPWPDQHASSDDP